jgi:hypothetical protein
MALELGCAELCQTISVAWRKPMGRRTAPARSRAQGASRSTRASSRTSCGPWARRACATWWHPTRRSSSTLRAADALRQRSLHHHHAAPLHRLLIEAYATGKALGATLAPFSCAVTVSVRSGRRQPGHSSCPTYGSAPDTRLHLLDLPLQRYMPGSIRVLAADAWKWARCSGVAAISRDQGLACRCGQSGSHGAPVVPRVSKRRTNSLVRGTRHETSRCSSRV